MPRDGLDRPLIVPKEGGRPVPFTRTTTFIDCIEDKTALSNWGERMVLIGAGMAHSGAPMWAEVSTCMGMLNGSDPLLHTEAKQRLRALCEHLKKRAGAHDKRDKGTELHGLSELVDEHIPLPAGLSDADMMDMAAYALATAGMRFLHIEEFVVVPQFKVGGTPDRIMEFEDWIKDQISFPEGADPDDSFIFDLKTGTVEHGGLKMASQLAVYSRGEFHDASVFSPPPYARKVTKRDDPEGFERWKQWDAWCKTEFDAELAASAYRPIPPVNQNWGIVCNLPAGSGDAELYWVDLRVGWEAAELAPVIRRMRSLSSKALRPFFSDQVCNVGSIEQEGNTSE